ncbi:alpha-N-acetylgalactosamine-specific lectin-like [Amphiura filiformis]|uniref:alpha-N-acetylgalactosamine-specific lectin-like n=1 Tax=Amphiura filiformis TaxID=82378 RepID=UPI003B2208D8
MFALKISVVALVIVSTGANLSCVCTSCELVCPDDGWSEANGGCYKFFSEKKTWQDANDHCKSLNADLVSIHSADENEYVWSLMGSEISWIGLNDVSSEGSFVWTDGSCVDYTSWQDDEPNQAGEEDCTEFYSHWNGNWNDKNCSVQRAFVCKMN